MIEIIIREIYISCRTFYLVSVFGLSKKKAKSVFGFENRFSDFSPGKRIIHSIASSDAEVKPP